MRDIQEAITTENKETLMPSLNTKHATTMTLTILAETDQTTDHAEECTVAVLQERDRNTATNLGSHIITENLEKA